MMVASAYRTFFYRLSKSNNIGAILTRALSVQTEAISKNQNASFPVLEVEVDCNDQSYQNATEKGMKSIQQLDKIMAVLSDGGGEKARKRHTELNKKLLVWDRISRLVDPGSEMIDLAPLAGLNLAYGDIPYGGMVCVIAKVRGRYCSITANDGTVKGGTYFPITVTKALRAQHISALHRLPSICLVDSGGGFLPLQAELFPDKQHGGRSFHNQAVLSAAGVPQVAVVCGSCTAGGAYAPTMSDEAVMVDRIGTLFLGGPPLVRAALGEVISEEELGGARLHCGVSGCCDMFAADEDEAFATTRDIIESLNLPEAREDVSEPPLVAPDRLDTLSGLSQLSRDELKLVLASVLDGSRFREFKGSYGVNVITGFGKLGGRLVGVVANHGTVTARDALKMAHLVELCDQRHIPLLYLQNAPPDTVEECSDPEVLKCRARAATVLAASRVPRISVNLTGCHGDQHMTMCGISFEPSFYFAWPRAKFSGVSLSAAAPAPDEAAAAPPRPGKPPSPADKPTKPGRPAKPPPLIQLPKDSSLYYASRVLIDGVIRPRDTRKTLELALAVVSWNTPQQERRHPVIRM
ncbi:biotin-dependent 3-methylcrotonyl-coenzyme A carboxylase beta1 subunit-like [Amphibalanus amphitrite]|uniref:biotin-dependent 3-methylcrotonyl-coenzyme A carboxylase beta1 subunit-like n=1 Tax=Amphibalanus amphitrite TaxID=1232801 RepID=UPI001C9202FD|nr:biotin-dependent 3-methylcrotonyl-coenzyme A carboxylase beta1 subunit-like [Amphibalanus amphitrite]